MMPCGVGTCCACESKNVKLYAEPCSLGRCGGGISPDTMRVTFYPRAQ